MLSPPDCIERVIIAQLEPLLGTRDTYFPSSLARLLTALPLRPLHYNEHCVFTQPRPEADIQQAENNQAKGAYSEAQPQGNIHCTKRYRRDTHTKLETG